jgi:hypothetical protein
MKHGVVGGRVKVIEKVNMLVGVGKECFSIVKFTFEVGNVLFHIFLY